MKRIRLAAAAVAAALTVAALAVTPLAASAAPTAHHIARISINGNYLYFVNGDGSERITGQGDDQQALLENTGATKFTQDSCGTSPQSYAFRNQTTPYKYLHYQTSNGHVSVSRETSNGCSNSADRWYVSGSGGCLFEPVNDSSVLMGANSDGSGAPVFIGTPNWTAFNCS